MKEEKDTITSLLHIRSLTGEEVLQGGAEDTNPLQPRPAPGGAAAGAKVVLPATLENIPRAKCLPQQRHRWNTNDELSSILLSFNLHEEWLSGHVQIRPRSGHMLLYSRKKVKYRRDGYVWKKRKDGKTIREDHNNMRVGPHQPFFSIAQVGLSSISLPFAFF